MTGSGDTQKTTYEPASFERNLVNRANWVRLETFKLHQVAPETRVASSLSPIEIFTALYYGGVLKYDAQKPYWEGRDRFVISKGHGSISMYPILADLGFFAKSELQRICHEGSFLGGIPDPIIPGYETVNGSLGHGLGVGCGMALGLRTLKQDSQVFVLVGDGELNEGSVWEAIMFAGHHRLENLTLIVDWNKVCMLDYTNKVLDMNSLEAKFKAFGFHFESVDGHDVNACQRSLKQLRGLQNGKPKVLAAETVKGKGSPQLETNSLCHITALNPADLKAIIERLSQ